MHKVLERQLRRVGVSVDGNRPPTAAQWQALVECIERAYTESDQDRYTLERSISLSSAEMNQLHEKLSSERDKLRALVGCLGDGLVVLDQQQRVELVNSEAERLLGWRSEELMEQPLAAVLTLGDSNPGRRSGLQARIASGERHRDDDARFATAAGTPLPVSFTLNPIVHDGVTEGAAMIFRDISERLAIEQALRDGEARLRSIFDSAPLGIFRLDPQGAILDANPAALRMFDVTREAIAGRTLASLFDDASPPSRLPSDGRAAVVVERQHTHADGRIAWFHTTETWVRDATGAVQFGTTIVDDVTAQKHLEGSLRHAQKLESVGRLAAGIAHELNTPIQFINDNVHFLKTSFETVTAFLGELRGLAADTELARAAEETSDWEYLGAEIPKSIAQTLDGLKRVATIVQSMKNFSHNDRGEQSLTDLNATLASTLIVATHELNGVAVAVESFGDIPPVFCSRGDLSQVFLNLIVNAAHAIGDVVKRTGKLGRIEIATRRDGEDVIVSISDTGDGIPKEVRSHMFEPFFTTKEVGMGSGQGLALARNIVVQRHRGTLTFESEVGVGTTFFIRLPIGGAAHGAKAA